MLEAFTFQQLIIIGLFLALFFREVLETWVRKMLGIPKNGSANATSKEISELRQHYNHETTKQLREINEGIQKLNRTHEEYDKFGIKMRQ